MYSGSSSMNADGNDWGPRGFFAGGAIVSFTGGTVVCKLKCFRTCLGISTKNGVKLVLLLIFNSEMYVSEM